MARPRKDQALGATATIGVRVTPDLRKRLERRAKRHKRALTEEVRDILEAAVASESDKAA
jgi:plasmid stability protein